MLIYSFSFWAVLQKCVHVPVHIHHVHFPYAKWNKLSKTSYMRFWLDVTWQRLQANTCLHLHSFNFQSCMFQLSLYNQTLCLFRPSELDGVICWAVFLVLCCWQPWIIQITEQSCLFVEVTLSPTPPSVLSSPLFFFPPFSLLPLVSEKIWFRCSGGYKEQQARSLSLSSVLQ